MNKIEDLKTKSMEFINEINKFTDDIKDIFSNYGFEVKRNEIKPFIAIIYQYETITYSPTESIINDIDLLNFLQEEEEYKLQSSKRKNYYTINFFQIIEIKSFIQQKISKDIKNFLEYIKTRTNIDIPTFKASQLSMDDWYQLLKKIDKKIEKDKELQTIEYILRFSTARFFIKSTVNKKGTKAISNNNLAFIYDLLYYIQNKNRNSTLQTKEKSDYIRYRLKKIPWEKIMGENQNISQKSNPINSNPS